MAVYLIITTVVRDYEVYKRYGPLDYSDVSAYGGKIVSAQDRTEVVEGNWTPHSIAILEFESHQGALSFSASYGPKTAQKLRHWIADLNIVCLG